MVLLISAIVPRGAWALAVASVQAQNLASWQARFSAAEVLRGSHVGQFVSWLRDITKKVSLLTVEDNFSLQHNRLPLQTVRMNQQLVHLEPVGQLFEHIKEILSGMHKGELLRVGI